MCGVGGGPASAAPVPPPDPVDAPVPFPPLIPPVAEPPVAPAPPLAPVLPPAFPLPVESPPPLPAMAPFCPLPPLSDVPGPCPAPVPLPFAPGKPPPVEDVPHAMAAPTVTAMLPRASQSFGCCVIGASPSGRRTTAHQALGVRYSLIVAKSLKLLTSLRTQRHFGLIGDLWHPQLGPKVGSRGPAPVARGAVAVFVRRSRNGGFTGLASRPWEPPSSCTCASRRGSATRPAACRPPEPSASTAIRASR